MTEVENQGFPPEVSLCFLFVGLLAGCLVTYFLSRSALNIPYAVVIFICGILLAYGAEKSNFYILGDSISQWTHVEPELLLFVFLPALIFGDAMSLNIHHMKQTFWSAILMGVPGSLIGTFILAGFSFAVLPYGWSWGLCLVFGAILSATDTVAVFALLKQADASPRLTILVVQESLYNDGAALVLFDLFYTRLSILNSDTYNSISSIIFYFSRVLILSPLVGISLGLATVCGLSFANRRISNDDITVQVALTICCAYLSFFIGEYVLDVSGVLCCCTAGISLAWLGPPLILQHETMHSVWKTIEWLGNTLIFLLGGLLFLTITKDGLEEYFSIGIKDIALIFLLYIAVLISRGIMISIFYPFMCTTYGSEVTWKECLFLTWSGVRGAVGITLALILVESSLHNHINVNNTDVHRLFFLVGGVVTLTLLINATLANKVLVNLKLIEDETTEEIRMMHHYARKRIHKRVNELIKEFKKQLPTFDLYVVAEYCKVVAMNSLHQPTNRSIRSEKSHKNIINYSIRSVRSEKNNSNIIRKLSNKATNVVHILSSNLSVNINSKSNININNNDDDDYNSEGENNFLVNNSKHSSVHSISNVSNITSANTTSSSKKDAVVELSEGAIEMMRIMLGDNESLDFVPSEHCHLLIDEGKLPRNSSAALALLYSIDIAQDSNNAKKYLYDWNSLQAHEHAQKMVAFYLGEEE
eukprot:gene8243-16953_t